MGKMGAGDGAPEIKTPLTEALGKDAKLRLRFVLFVAKRILAYGTLADAEEIVSAAYELAMKHEKEGNGWKPESEKPYGQYMFEIVRGQAANFRRGRRRDKTVQLEKPEWEPSKDPSPEAEAERLERARLTEKVKEALADDSQGELPLRMFEAAATRGVEGHAELARDLQVPLSVIQKAERRIERVAGEVLEALRLETMRRKLARSR